MTIPDVRESPAVRWQLDFPLPPWRPIRQNFPHHGLPAPAAAVAEQLARPDIASRIRPGMRVAVGVGSRGIKCLSDIVAALVGGLRALEAEPFIVPAMGSHGGATAEGQRDLLSSYGITESSVRAPVRSSMDVVKLGEVLDGIEVVFDRLALSEADAIVPVARVKPHSDFRAHIESGLHKMLAIGFGKQRGAIYLHTFPLDQFGDLLPAVAHLIVSRVNVPFGIAIVEDAYEDPAIIEAVAGEAMALREPELLRLAREWLPQLPAERLDVLVVQEMGKDISGPGMDPNVTGRYTMPSMRRHVEIRRLVVLDLTEQTHGNATGMGMADIVTRRLADQVDFVGTYINHVSANSVEGAKLPLVAETDREALTIATKTLGRTHPSDAKIAWVQNTLRLDRMWVSNPLWSDVRRNRIVESVGLPRRIAFDAQGSLILEWPS